jgi:transposase
MKSVPALTDTEREALAHLYSRGPTHRQRQRAQAALLSAKGDTLGQIADVLGAGRSTVSGWLDDWQEQGLCALADAPKAGRVRSIDAALEAELLDLLQNPTPDLKAVVQAHLKKSRLRLLGHRQEVPEAAGLHLPPRPARAAQSAAPGRARSSETCPGKAAPHGRRGPVPSLVRR